MAVAPEPAPPDPRRMTLGGKTGAYPEPTELRVSAVITPPATVAVEVALNFTTVLIAGIEISGVKFIVIVPDCCNGSVVFDEIVEIVEGKGFGVLVELFPELP